MTVDIKSLEQSFEDFFDKTSVEDFWRMVKENRTRNGQDILHVLADAKELMNFKDMPPPLNVGCYRETEGDEYIGLEWRGKRGKGSVQLRVYQVSVMFVIDGTAVSWAESDDEMDGYYVDYNKILELVKKIQ